MIATGDSTVSITCIDRSTRTHPLLSNDTLVIPNTVIHNGYEYQVEGIEDNAFIGCKDIKHLIISEGIDYIGENAFSYCTEL
ncbi:leucine-rich repeat protein [Paraprevotella xylaniphila]|nr:leucine-rich repeat protein [Paraprevotella xylaniphila]